MQIKLTDVFSVETSWRNGVPILINPGGARNDLLPKSRMSNVITIPSGKQVKLIKTSAKDNTVIEDVGSNKFFLSLDPANENNSTFNKTNLKDFENSYHANINQIKIAVVDSASSDITIIQFNIITTEL